MTQESVQRLCGAFLACMRRFKALLPDKFVQAEVAELRKACRGLDRGELS